ncbi:MAG: ATP-binding cassette domain-containing protein [Myxococcota bacterium]
MESSATTNPLAIEVRALVKRFGEVTALDGLDLRVPRGSCFGLLGPNGAGKTTTVSILTTLIRPTVGIARLLGRDVVAERDAVRRDLGLVFQESTLDPELTSREHLDLYGRLYHLENRRARVDEILALLGLEELADRPTRFYSGGMKRRLEIGRGLLHRPQVLFLDEPTLGLDVHARRTIWEHLRSLSAGGETTVFLTTHSMEEADALCEQIAIIDHGRVVVSGSPSRLKSDLGGDVVRLALERADGAVDRLNRLDGVSEVIREDPDSESTATLRVTLVDGPRRLAALIEAARPFGVLEVTMQRPTLDHVFLHHTGHSFDGPTDSG